MHVSVVHVVWWWVCCVDVGVCVLCWCDVNDVHGVRVVVVCSVRVCVWCCVLM